MPTTGGGGASGKIGSREEGSAQGKAGRKKSGMMGRKSIRAGGEEEG